LKKKGFKTEREHVLIQGVPVQFIPVYNDLVKEAVQYSEEVKYGRIKTKVLGLEYLIAVMLQTNRPKDRGEHRKFVFLLMMISAYSYQISALLGTSSLIIHTKNTSGQQKIYKKEKTPENQPNNATPRTEISLSPELKD